MLYSLPPSISLDKMKFNSRLSLSGHDFGISVRKTAPLVIDSDPKMSDDSSKVIDTGATSCVVAGGKYMIQSLSFDEQVSGETVKLVISKTGGLVMKFRMNTNSSALLKIVYSISMTILASAFVNP